MTTTTTSARGGSWERAFLLAALCVSGWFFVTRLHDDRLVRTASGCVMAGEQDAADDAARAALYARCGVHEKKLLYVDGVWGNNHLLHPAMRDDFGEFARSLVAFVPWAALAIARRWGKRTSS